MPRSKHLPRSRRRTVGIWFAWTVFGLCLVATGLDCVTNRSEPLHVLALSWVALDGMVAQVAVALMTRKAVKDSDG